jgi:hypothetical protein
MSIFETLFSKSKGQPIQYDNEILYRIDYWEIENHEVIKLRIESTNSEWRQGVRLVLEKGYFKINGKNCGQNIGIWQDTALKECIIEIILTDIVKCCGLNF